MQVPDTASAPYVHDKTLVRCNGATPAPGEHQIGLSRTLSASSGAVTVSGPPFYDPVDEQRQAGASSDLADRHPVHGDGVCTASPPLERLPAAADSAGPQAGRYCHAGTVGTVSLVTT